MLDKKEKCDYPNCLAKHTCIRTLDIINDETKSINLMFCEYHGVIIAGGRFKAKIKKSKDKEVIKFEIVGPLLEVEMAEAVMGAIEFVKTKK